MNWLLLILIVSDIEIILFKLCLWTEIENANFIRKVKVASPDETFNAICCLLDMYLQLPTIFMTHKDDACRLPYGWPKCEVIWPMHIMFSAMQLESRFFMKFDWVGYSFKFIFDGNGFLIVYPMCIFLPKIPPFHIAHMLFHPKISPCGIYRR